MSERSKSKRPAVGNTAQPAAGNTAQPAAGNTAQPAGENGRDRDPSAPLDEVERDDAVIGKAFRWSLALIALVAATAGGGVFWYTRKPVDNLGLVGPVGLPKKRDRSQAKVPRVVF